MGAGDSRDTSKIVLADGTDVGVASEDGKAFAEAIQRMHSILHDCDDELLGISDAANTHGQQSEQFASAFRRLEACQRRRANLLRCIEADCGPSQDDFRACCQEKGEGPQCLPVLHKFLDCAERAVAKAS